MKPIKMSLRRMILIMLRQATCCLLLMADNSCSVSHSIARQAETILLKDTAISKGQIGISIYEPATGKYWYEHDAEKYFIPASNTKLFTLYAGLKYLGDSLPGIGYRKIAEGNTTLIYPTGDPTFLHPDYKDQPILDFLNKQEKLIIATTPEPNLYGKGWAWDDYADEYMIPLSAFPLYGNTVRINWRSKDSMDFFPSYFSHEADRTEPMANGFTLFKEFGENRLLLKAGTTKQTNTPFASDWKTSAHLLEDTLQLKKSIALSVADEGPVTLLRSRPVDSLFIPMMHRSDNYFAEQTLLMVSYRLLGRMNTGNLIDTLLRSDLKDMPHKPQWVDGSGLSRYNLFTPQSFTYLLNKMCVEFGQKRLEKILPTGGEGTLKRYYLKDSSFLFAKTGTLSNNCALSGFMVTKGGKWLIFSILSNNYQTSATPIRRAIERFLEQLREKY